MLIFEFAGMPKSGKTTVLELIRHELRRLGYRVIDYHGGGRYAPIDKEFLPELNLYLVAEAIRFLTQMGTISSSSRSVALMDRGIFDRIIFTQALLTNGLILEAEALSTIRLLSLERLRGRLSKVLLFKTSPTLRMEREHKYQISPRLGRVMNLQTLMTLRDALDHCYATHGTLFPGVELIDTESLDGSITGTAEQILRTIRPLLHEQVPS